MSTQKRRAAAPLPIFNKGKRPRQALLAHPNNLSSPVQPQGASQWKKNGEAASQWAPFNGNCSQQKRQMQPQSIKYHAPTNTPQWNWGSSEQENQQSQEMSHYSTSQRRFTPHRSGGGRQTQYDGYAPYSQPPPTQTATNAPLSNPPPISRGRFGSLVSNRSYSKPQTTNTCGPSLKPTESQGTKLNTSGPSFTPPKTRRGLRVLTATAKGMQYWSQYTHHTATMLFEVFGTVNSPVSLGTTGAKEFTLQASDGTVKCLFWEMDRKLPHLVRGHMHRVVGTWDSQKQCMKCYTVRPVRAREEQYIKHHVEASDSNMRQLVASLPEM